ncbi:hypothetical protein PFDSM3638_01740 [Pyrococcus furiosus DSM 3638]|uniref:Uncharacterized protein PF0383 n=3 Tax=Pyrococcus furiosus TaxID=2261 RepID=Y383_PYRFU|nr:MULTISPECIES: DUF3194 domain-containing protein [Pyrococcus]Q8U3S2.1 RecName: Full=Uncharacterized protein PF0383 [Pyrococcus furiosus DSM 3638]AAL80507.1 hypothetical protein PF0383 [Pyrococcus furiosus DSM 3638]AFN03143.1 hypothetical protein PFC_00850 [Pyrococcus furiosus COM1]MDK2869988.1 hypothetical protein [Pyrococcus sp.]QEK78071.1 hypothetical protein PFDSM3638_01740 [Pyrococcus furiosus DSM 3638]
MKKVIHIGLPELSEEELIRVGEIGQKIIINYIFDHLAKSEVRDLEVTARINRGETLDLELEVYVEVPIFVKVDVESLIEEALDKAYEAIEDYLRRISNERGEKAQRTSEEP